MHLPPVDATVTAVERTEHFNGYPATGIQWLLCLAIEGVLQSMKTKLKFVMIDVRCVGRQPQESHFCCAADEQWNGSSDIHSRDPDHNKKGIYKANDYIP
jgi:hypothetical protein